MLSGSSGSASRGGVGPAHAEQDGGVGLLEQGGGFGAEGLASAVEDGGLFEVGREVEHAVDFDEAVGGQQDARANRGRLRGRGRIRGAVMPRGFLRVGLLDELVVVGVQVDLADVGDVRP